MKVYPLADERREVRPTEVKAGMIVHRVHLSDERHDVLYVGKNVVLLNQSGYAYTFSADPAVFWQNYELVGAVG